MNVPHNVLVWESRIEANGNWFSAAYSSLDGKLYRVDMADKPGYPLYTNEKSHRDLVPKGTETYSDSDQVKQVCQRREDELVAKMNAEAEMNDVIADLQAELDANLFERERELTLKVLTREAERDQLQEKVVERDAKIAELEKRLAEQAGKSTTPHLGANIKEAFIYYSPHLPGSPFELCITTHDKRGRCSLDALGFRTREEAESLLFQLGCHVDVPKNNLWGYSLPKDYRKALSDGLDEPPAATIPPATPKKPELEWFNCTDTFGNHHFIAWSNHINRISITNMAWRVTPRLVENVKKWGIDGSHAYLTVCPEDVIRHFGTAGSARSYCQWLENSYPARPTISFGEFNQGKGQQ